MKMNRVTCKRRYPVNDLLIDFLTQLKENERTKNGDSSRMFFTYGQALKSLKVYPIEIKEVEELKNLMYFGDVIVAKLTKKLADFRKEHGEPTLKLVKKRKDASKGASELPKTRISSEEKEFKPKPGSGSYAILRTLYDDAIFNGGIENGGLYLEDLRKAADVYSREAMVKNSALQHYTPFSCLTTLTTKCLIKRKKVGRKDVVSLTEEGFKLGEKLSMNDHDNSESSTDGAELKINLNTTVPKTNLPKKLDKITGPKRIRKSPISNLSKSEERKIIESTKIKEKVVDFDLTADDSDHYALMQSDEEVLLPLSDRLASKSVGISTKTFISSDDFDNQPGPSWKGLPPSVAKIETISKSLLNSSESYDGYVFITPDLNETLLKSEACQERNPDLEVDIVWIKSTESYVKTKSFLYVLSSNDGIFEDPFLLIHLAIFDAEDIAPGLKRIDLEPNNESNVTERSKFKSSAEQKTELVQFTKVFSKSTKIQSKDELGLSSNQTKKFTDVQIVSDEIVLEPNTFDIILIADFAEVKGGVAMTGEKNSNRRDLLSDYFQERGIRFESRKLNVGDYLWIARNRHSVDSIELVLDLIIERKRIDDLAKSITDGRWDSQKYRLKRCGLRKVMYLFEDLPKSMKQPAFNPAALRSAMINTEIQDGFSVEKTLHVKDTAEFISRMTKFLIRNFKGKRLTCRKFNDYDEIPESDGVFDLDSYSIALLPFEEFQKLALKPRRFTVGDTFVMCLMQISGVSIELAKGIGAKFGTFRNLMNAYDECGDDEKAKIKLLEDVKSGAQSRRLGPSLAKKIADYFCYETQF